jgi:hypothetical protein
MKPLDVVIHVPAQCNWWYEGATKNPRSGNRKVVIVELYNNNECAVITPVSGNGVGQQYVCNVTELRKLGA